MLSDAQREIVRSTVPVLRAHGETIARTFYDAMLGAHPELLDYFNPANQRDGGQARSLAASVLAYAAHVDRPDDIGGMVERISNKHVSLEVKAEHYPIVGRYLLGAIGDVLGEAATPEILDAWAAAYGQLAAIMSGRERALYAEASARPGGWRGFKPFRVDRKVRESEATTSLHLVPVDGAPLPVHEPGQYVSVRIRPPGRSHEQVRQYSLSDLPDGRHYRISVKRETAPGAPDGVVSGFLHDLAEGDVLMVHAPAGDFVLDGASERPVALISGGAGITAVLAMLEHLATRTTRDVLMLHGVRSRAHHAFAARVRELSRLRPGIRSVTLYGKVGPDDVPGEHYDAVGRVTAAVIRRHLPPGGAELYCCGPLGVMAGPERALDELGIASTRRHSEAFAPDPSFAAGSTEPRPLVEAD